MIPTTTRLDGKPDVRCDCCGLIHGDPLPDDPARPRLAAEHSPAATPEGMTPMTEDRFALLRVLAGKARDALAEAQRIYAAEGQTARWESAKNRSLSIRADYHAAASPDVILSLLSEAPANQPSEGDRRMLLVWEAWAKEQGNDGAAILFRRCADSPTEVTRLRTALAAAENERARVLRMVTEAREHAGNIYGIMPALKRLGQVIDLLRVPSPQESPR